MSEIIKRTKRGFTLLEMLMVVAIVGTEADLQNFLPQGYTVEIATPWNNVTYENVLNLDAPVSFTRNGKTYYSNKGTN